MSTTNLSKAAQLFFVPLALIGLTQAGCYNTYFINKDELQKLESSVDRIDVVDVYADCPAGAAPAAEAAASGASRYRVLGQTPKAMWAQADGAAPAEGEATATDATDAGGEAKDVGPPPGKEGCEKVAVSTANTLKVITSKDEEERVTPFNFLMANGQLVSPEYDLLLSLNDVKGAEVREFSGWKTAFTIIGVTAVTVGSFVGISLLAEEEPGFR